VVRTVMPGLVPGIHAFTAANLLRPRRGWPGLIARRRASRFCSAKTRFALLPGHDEHLLPGHDEHRGTNISDQAASVGGLFQCRHRNAAIVSKMGGDQIIGAPASANIDPGRGGTYQVTVGIERVQKTRLVEAGVRLNSL
jgi:hypothetical protein